MQSPQAQAVRQKVAYGRVSTQQQADQGALERQEKTLLEAAGADQVILDVGSGKTTSRPGYQRLLEMIANGQVEQVLVADQDRLNRNLQADLELWGLCDANQTRITDLNGREIEFRSPDGELLSTVVSALNQHRSKAYGAKTKRGLEQARKQGLPARPRVPFGFRKVRNEQGRFVSIEPDPQVAQHARERIDWFLGGKGLTGTCRLIGEYHPRETWMQPAQLKRWLKNPSLTGRLCWHKQGNSGDFAQVEAKPSFQGLINDTEAARINALLEGLSLGRARAGRTTRMMSGLAKCADCNQILSHKVSGKSTWYLRCANPYCPQRNHYIRLDKTIRTLKDCIKAHAPYIVREYNQAPEQPEEANVLRTEISALRKIRGTEELVREKEKQIENLLTRTNDYARYLLLETLMTNSFWEQEEEKINSDLRGFVEYVRVQLDKSVRNSFIIEIRMKTVGRQIAEIPTKENSAQNKAFYFFFTRQDETGEIGLFRIVPAEETEFLTELAKRGPGKEGLDMLSERMSTVMTRICDDLIDSPEERKDDEAWKELTKGMEEAAMYWIPYLGSPPEGTTIKAKLITTDVSKLERLLSEYGWHQGQLQN